MTAQSEYSNTGVITFNLGLKEGLKLKKSTTQLYLGHYLELLSLPNENQTNGAVTRITVENF
jgi:hypothetical protein